MTTSAHPRLAGLVLAAGGSTRLGEPKQLIDWRGESLVVRAVKSALAACGAGVCVVTGGAAAQVEAEVSALAVVTVRNPDWEQGMASTLQHGFAALDKQLVEGVLVLLCDQPLIGSEDIEQLQSLWMKATDEPVASRYNGTVGVPAIFPVSMGKDFEGLSGDGGAKPLLERIPGHRLIEMPDAGFDVDTPDDLLNLRRRS
jgi:molybdenum cofactor cytidylyltransferase